MGGSDTASPTNEKLDSYRTTRPEQGTWELRYGHMRVHAPSFLKWITRGISFQSEVFSTMFCFGATAVLKLFSSIVLTRLLYPEAYGIIALLSSVVFILEMLSDIGVIGLMVRHARTDREFLNTLWTIRFARGWLNAIILFAAAPYIAKLYETPELTVALRIFSASFVLHGFQSMGFLIAMRERRARVVNYRELYASIISTAFTLAFSYYSRDHYGMIYGMLVNSASMVVFSYTVNGSFKPRFAYDAAAAKDLFGFARYVGPSSALTLALGQFERIVFLKLFDLHLLGLYGLASGVVGPVEGVIGRLSRSVLYPRCAENYRNAPESASRKYYSDNVKLFALIMFFPAAVGGSADLIVKVLFDARYVGAAAIAQVLCLRIILSSLAAPAEDLLVAAGESRVVLIGNVLRLAWLVPMSLAGYRFFGFWGFLCGAMTDLVPSLFYLWWKQSRLSMIEPRHEFYKVIYLVLVFLASSAVSHQALILLTKLNLLHR